MRTCFIGFTQACLSRLSQKLHTAPSDLHHTTSRACQVDACMRRSRPAQLSGLEVGSQSAAALHRQAPQFLYNVHISDVTSSFAPFGLPVKRVGDSPRMCTWQLSFALSRWFNSGTDLQMFFPYTRLSQLLASGSRVKDFKRRLKLARPLMPPLPHTVHIVSSPPPTTRPVCCSLGTLCWTSAWTRTL